MSLQSHFWAHIQRKHNLKRYTHPNVKQHIYSSKDMKAIYMSTDRGMDKDVVYIYIMEYCCCCCLVAKSCLTLCNSMDCSPPGFSVHGILQVRIWSGLPFPCSGHLSDPGIKPASPALAADSLPLSHLGRPNTYK